MDLESDNAIQFMIDQKRNCNKPFYATKELAEQVMSPFDGFPYKFWFRGEFDNSRPVVMDRTAGYRERHDQVYKFQPVSRQCTPGYCWSQPCSTVRPCRPNQVQMQRQIDYDSPSNTCPQGRGCGIVNVGR
jgi:hypothetical protein